MDCKKEIDGADVLTKETKKTKKIIEGLLDVMPPDQVLDEHRVCFRKAKEAPTEKREEYNDCMETVLSKEKRKEKYGF